MKNRFGSPGTTTRLGATTNATAMAVAWLAIIWLWPMSPLTLTVDDSFYYFQTARHLAAGHGPTFDGVQATNGFHPLWMAAIVPMARILGRHPDTFVRFVLTGQIVLVALGTRMLVGAERRAGAHGAEAIALVFAVLATNFYFTKIFVNGLESALELALIAASFDAGVRVLSTDDAQRRGRWLAVTGGLCAAVTLARLTAFVFACLLLAVLWRRVRPRPHDALATLAAFTLPLALFGAWAHLRFGHVIPVSAAIKNAGPLATSPVVLLVAIVAMASVATVAWIEQRARDGTRPPLWLLPLVGYVGVQTACDALLRDVLVPEIWYLVPHATLLALGCSKYLLPALAGRCMVRAGLLSALLAASLLTWLARLSPVGYSTYVAARTTGQWVARHTPSSARVAGWDCGISAFYSDRAFSNLDGLISSWDYKTNYLDRGRVREFLDDAKVDVVAQYADVGPRDEPASDKGLILKDVDLSDWRVVYEERFEFRGIMDTLLSTLWSRSSPRAFRYVVLARPPQ